jgi:hypothetical protein
MSERRCLYCHYFNADMPVANLLAEDAAVTAYWGPQVGFGGHCTHPRTPYRYGTNSRGCCGLYEERGSEPEGKERGPDPESEELVREPFMG